MGEDNKVEEDYTAECHLYSCTCTVLGSLYVPISNSYCLGDDFKS